MLTPTKEVLEERKNKPVVYRALHLKTKNTETEFIEEKEKALKPIMFKLAFVKCGWKYGTQ